MTPSHRSPTSPVLPIMDETGTITPHPNLLDSRVPMRFLLSPPPRVLAADDRNDECPDGRHLWDAILATGEPIPGDVEGDEVQPFRLRLTCTRCDLVRELSGLVDQSLYRAGLRLIPTPMTAGDLVAQEIRRDCTGDRPLSTWAVHPRAGGLPIGAIGWSRGLRGRLFHVGRLYDNPSRYFEGRSPLSCLQLMARAVADRAGAAG
jgi:hypothetical protein